MNVFVDINLDHSPSHMCMLGTNYIWEVIIGEKR